MPEAKKQADTLLLDIYQLENTVATIERAHEEEAAAVAKKYEPLVRPLAERLERRVKALKDLMKKETADLFGGADIIRLANGLLTHTTERRVTIPRDALEKVEAQGWTEAVKIKKSVDRPVVEAWPTERLTVIGAKKRLVHIFGYEVKKNV